MQLKLAIGLLAAVASTKAHATFQQLWVNGKDLGGYCVRLPASNSPVTDVTSADIACNVGAKSTPYVCDANPGDSITVEMHQQPGDRSCASEAIGGAHYGPVIVYMAKVADASTAVGSSASWFKVSQMGLASNNPDYFAVQVLNNNCGHWTFKIPSDLAPGHYLIRPEVIALHAASPSGGAQFYMSCIQIKLGGSGTANPPGVKLPGAYSPSDPGIGVNIHTDLTTYTVPGPTVYGGGNLPMVTTAYPTAATWTLTPTGTPAPPTGTGTGAPTPTGSTTPGTIPQYGQCGGIGWTGTGTCQAGFTCKVISDYYYQCL